MNSYRKSYKRKPRKCPECQYSPVATVMYGMPVMDKKLEEKLAKGVVSIGGCSVSPDDPTWKCTSCEREFYKLDKSHTLIRFRVDQYMSGLFELIVDDYGSLIKLSWGRVEPVEIDRKIVDELIDILLEIDVFTWKKEYVNHNILDGMGWELEVNINGKYVHSEGINAYPEGFDELQDKIENIVKSLVDVDELY